MGIIEFMPSNPEAVRFHTSIHNGCSLKSRWNVTLNSKEGPRPAWVGPVCFCPPEQMDRSVCLLVQPNKWSAIFFCCLSSKLTWRSHSAQPLLCDVLPLRLKWTKAVSSGINAYFASGMSTHPDIHRKSNQRRGWGSSTAIWWNWTLQANLPIG